MNDDKPLIGIYRIFCIIDGQSYVGQSKDIQNRWKQHADMLLNNSHHSKKLQSAFNTYGSNFFLNTILQTFPTYDKELLNKAERYWIHYFNSYYRGYNGTLGG